MALQVWLPLNGEDFFPNYGLKKVTFDLAQITNTFIDGILGKCLINEGDNYISFTVPDLSAMLANGKTYSLACWVKVVPSITTQHWVIKFGENQCGLWLGKSSDRWVWNENDNGKRCVNVNISADTTNWHHLVITVDKTVADQITERYYVDGAPSPDYEYNTFSNAGMSEPTGTKLYINAYASCLNDVRLYDHILSRKEIKELSKCLIRHYPLNNSGYGNPNLLRNSNFLEGTNGLDGWSINGNNTTCTKQNDCIKIVSTADNGGIYSRNYDSIVTDIITTFSAYVKADSTMTIYIGVDGTGITNCQAYTVGTEWQCISITKPKYSADHSVRVYGNGTFYVKYTKYELGSKVTAWLPNVADELYISKFNIEYDVAGYKINGERNNITFLSDTAKNRCSTVFDGTTSYIEANPLPLSTVTISVWVKTTWKSSSGYRLAVHDKNSTLAIGWSGNNLITYIGSGSGGTGSRIDMNNTNYTINEWNHIVVVKTENNGRNVYVNGILAAPNTNNYWGGDQNTLNIGNRHINGDYTAYFNGQLSDFRAYATALSADDVKELYEAPISFNKHSMIIQGEYVEEED